MSISISFETEARLTEEALKQNVSIDTLLGRFLNERGTRGVVENDAQPTVPVLHLGVIGPLRRRDIYDDGR